MESTNNPTPGRGDQGQQAVSNDSTDEKQSGKLSIGSIWNLIKRFKWLALISLLLALSGFGFNIYRLNKESKLEAQEIKQAQRKFRILVPLFASNQEYLNYMKLESGKKYQAESFSRKVSSDTVKAVEASMSAWLKSPLVTVTGARFREDKIDFYFYPEGSDNDSYKRAFYKAMKEAEIQGYEVVGIIGHVTSTVTQACGEIYKEYAKENKTTPVPMILPLATATSLTYALSLNDGPAVLRLPPANDKQAELISHFLLNKGATRVTIIRDLSNTVYSNDLIGSFHTHFVDQPFRNKSLLEQLESKHGQILAIVPVGGESGEPFLHTSVSNLKGDALLLFAMTEASLETIAQARAAGITASYTILTDGAIDEHLIPRANALVYSQASSRVGIIPASNMLYLTFPLETPLPEKLKEVLSEVPERFSNLNSVDPDDPKNLSMTHAQYVVDAVQIALTIIFRDIIQAKNSQDGKDVLSNTIKSWQDKRKVEGIPFSYDKTRIYEIDAFGNSTNMRYHLFRAKLPGKIDKAKLNLKDIKWFHDTGNCLGEPSANLQAKE
jgi:hypothetical protein